MLYRIIIAGGFYAASVAVAGAGEVQSVQAFNPPPAKEGYSYPDCFCTDSEGERVELGQHVCLQIGSRQVWAYCDMSQNNPAWRHQEGGCPSV
ncbi:MAG: hypothetical protein AAGH74_14615 [Pseudomonadota bacterium]